MNVVSSEDMEINDIGQVSKRTKVPEATLRYWRYLGDRGPRSFKVGRRVMYRKVDVDEWLMEQYKAAEPVRRRA